MADGFRSPVLIDTSAPVTQEKERKKKSERERERGGGIDIMIDGNRVSGTVGHRPAVTVVVDIYLTLGDDRINSLTGWLAGWHSPATR